MPVVYIDVLFAVNLIINYIILHSCSVFVDLKQNKLRISFGAVIGASYAVLVFFPDFNILYSALSKFLVSMVIVASAYPFYTVKNYINKSSSAGYKVKVDGEMISSTEGLSIYNENTLFTMSKKYDEYGKITLISFTLKNQSFAQAGWLKKIMSDDW